MNKHTRLVVSLLFMFIIVLAAAITRFYYTEPEGTGSNSSQAEIVRRLDSDSKGNRIFSDSNSLYGVIDGSDRIIVAPEWNSLEFAADNCCIASKRIGGHMMCGCIDYEGNIIIPFIYRSITGRSAGKISYYTAVSDSDNSVVIYSSSFRPMFRRSWDSCVANTNGLVLSTAKGIYTYSPSSEDFLFKSASVTGEALGCSYTFDISSRVLLSKLNVNMLEMISDSVGRYLEYAYSGNDDMLSSITTGSHGNFIQLFPDDHKILSKRLISVPDIYIYSAKSEDDTPHYSVSVVTDTEINYSDETGEAKTMRDEYRASIEFSGSSESNLTAVSGSFLQSAPEYPKLEPPTESAEENDNNDPQKPTGPHESYDGDPSPKIEPTTASASQ